MVRAVGPKIHACQDLSYHAFPPGIANGTDCACDERYGRLAGTAMVV